MFFGRARDLLGAFLRLRRRPFGFEGRVQHLLAALRNSPHVLPAIFEGLHDYRRRPGFRRRRLGRFLHRANDAADIDLNFACKSFDFLRAFVGRLRQRANLVGDDRKASPVIAGARRLDRGVQSQETCLVRDAADRLRDLADIPRAALQFGDDSTVAPCRCALRSMARAEAVMRSPASPSMICTVSVRRRRASVSPRAVRRPSNIRLIAASCSCDAPAASSAPAAICSIDLRNCSAAAEACVSPLANSSVAAATCSKRTAVVEASFFSFGGESFVRGVDFDAVRTKGGQQTGSRSSNF